MTHSPWITARSWLWIGLLLGPLVSPMARADVAGGLQWLQSRDSIEGVHRPGDLANAADTNAEAFITAALLSHSSDLPGTVSLADDEHDETLLSIADWPATIGTGQSAATQLQLLVASQQTDGGFPAQSGLQSEPLTTAWTLSALDRAGGAGQTEVSRALSFLIGAQQSDGGWLAAPGNFSHVVPTAQVLRVLFDYRNRYALTQPIARALAFLQAARRPDHTFGEIFETASVLDTLVAVGVEHDSLGPVAGGLATAQFSVHQ